MVIGGILLATAFFSLVDCLLIPVPERWPTPPCTTTESNDEVNALCCTYASNFSEWRLSNFRPVLTDQCTSGFVVVEARVKAVLYGECDDQREERIAECAPERSLRLALLLDLGGSGQNTKTFGGSLFNGSASLEDPGEEQLHHTKERICRTGRIKRAVSEEYEYQFSDEPQQTLNVEPLEEDPIPFNIHRHGHRYTRQQQSSVCDAQYVLFILDTSDSIGHSDFYRMTNVLGELVHLFCKPTKFAAMTFSDRYIREFCFDQFDNNCAGRFKTKMAFQSIHYRGGATHTGEAVQCASNNLLTEQCGLPQDAECVSIVFLTDGISNGEADVCGVINELKGSRKFESYSVGIGGHTHKDGLNCIASDQHHTFHYPNFDVFVEELLMIETLFDNSNYLCVNHPTVGQTLLDDEPEDCKNFELYSGSGDY